MGEDKQAGSVVMRHPLCWCHVPMLLAGLLFPVGVWAQAENKTDEEEEKPLSLRTAQACVFAVVDGKLILDNQLRGVRMVNRLVGIEGLPGGRRLWLRPQYYILENSITLPGGGSSTLRINLRYSQLTIRQDTPDWSYEFSQDRYDDTRLTVYGSNGATIRNVSAGTFGSLLKDHPGEVIRFMGPLFRTFRTKALFGADAKLARTVLTPHRPGPEVEFLVSKIVRQLDSESFSDREAGAASVRQIGTEALAVLQKMDREALSPQQQTAIDAIATEMGITPAEADRLRKN